MTSTINYRREEIFKVKPAVSVKNKYAGITIPRNPGMAPNDFSNAHQDSYASESVSVTGPTSGTLKLIVQSHQYGLTGVHSCNTANQMIAVGAWLGVGFHLLVYDRDCHIISATKLESAYGLSFAGGYFYLDNHDDAILCSSQQIVCYPTANVAKRNKVYSLTPKWQTDNLVQMVTGQPDGNALYASLPVWGQPNLYWCLFAGNYDIETKTLSSNAFVAVVKIIPDSQATDECVTTLIDKGEFPNEWNNNSISADEEGLYFVLNTVKGSGEPEDYGTLHKYVYDSTTKTIYQGWAYQYESCGLLLTGQTNIGSGTTPTLTNTDDGTKLVAITDNASPQVNVVVLDRVSGTLVSKTPVFAKMRSADEASPIGVKDSFIAENNYGHTIGVLPQLVSNEPGMTSIDVKHTVNSSEVIWDNTYTTFFGMSMLARGSGIIFGFSGSWHDQESSTSGALYSIVAMDSFSGRVIWRIPVGRGMLSCHEYGGFYFNHTGDLFVGSNGHLICVQNATSNVSDVFERIQSMK